MLRFLALFPVIWAAMIANSFWEAYVEGKHAWDEGKLGWKLDLGFIKLTAYHFWLFWVMWPLLLSMPLILTGWNSELFGILASAYFSGLVVQDFFWFVVNPAFDLKHFDPKHVKWYPWLSIGRIHIPLFYLVGIGLALLSWALFWR